MQLPLGRRENKELRVHNYQYLRQLPGQKGLTPVTNSWQSRSITNKARVKANRGGFKHPHLSAQYMNSTRSSPWLGQRACTECVGSPLVQLRMGRELANPNSYLSLCPVMAMSL